MNKLHVLALTGLVFCGANNASMGQEQREVLYALHTLGQNFADVPMIVQNIDMFAGVLEMNIQINEAKLKVANQKIKDTLWKSGALLGGIWLVQHVSSLVLHKIIRDDYFVFPFSKLDLHQIRLVIEDNSALSNFLGLAFVGKVFAALNIYDVWKNRSALMEALALDKEILSKLEEIKISMDFIEENTDSTENFLLNSAE